MGTDPSFSTGGRVLGGYFLVTDRISKTSQSFTPRREEEEEGVVVGVVMVVRTDKGVFIGKSPSPSSSGGGKGFPGARKQVACGLPVGFVDIPTQILTFN